MPLQPTRPPWQQPPRPPIQDGRREDDETAHGGTGRHTDDPSHQLHFAFVRNSAKPHRFPTSPALHLERVVADVRPRNLAGAPAYEVRREIGTHELTGVLARQEIAASPNLSFRCKVLALEPEDCAGSPDGLGRRLSASSSGLTTPTPVHRTEGARPDRFRELLRTKCDDTVQVAPLVQNLDPPVHLDSATSSRRAAGVVTEDPHPGPARSRRQ